MTRTPQSKKGFRAWVRRHPKKLTALLTAALVTLGPGWPVIAPLVSGLIVDTVAEAPEA